MVHLCILGISLLTATQTTVPQYEKLPVSYICIEAETGMVLTESNADLQRPPASMLKMMEMLLVEEGVLAGKWNYDTLIKVTKNAQGMGGTQVYLEAGEEWPLEKLLMSMAVLSANDASYAVAEGLWGSVTACLEAMNARAKELGMKNTLFRSVHGLPPSDRVSFDLSSARDMAILGRELLKHPQVLTRSSTKEFSLRPENAAKASTNKLLERMPECDGLKTGYIRASGFCLTATAKRNDIRLIAVVMGSDKEGRFNHTKSLLNECFEKVKRVQPVTAGMPIGRPVPVHKSLDTDVRLCARDAISAIVKTEDIDRLSLEITAPVALEAPIQQGAEFGNVRLMLEDQALGTSPLLVDKTVEKISLRDRGFGCMGRKE